MEFLKAIKTLLIIFVVLIIFVAGATFFWFVFWVSAIIAVIWLTAKYYGNKLGQAIRNHSEKS